LDGGESELERVIAGVRERLPEYMAPAEWVRMESLPLTVNGKVDRRGLPAAEHARAERRGDYLPPRTPVEQTLAEIWAETLGIEKIGVNDSFFDLGGHSLLAMQIVARVRESFGADLPLAKLFDHPTIARLAELVAEARTERRSAISPSGSPSGPSIARRARSMDQQLLDLERLSS